MEATVAICRCGSASKTYGIRFEKNKRGWVYNWAFKIGETAANKEGYGETKIMGSPDLSPDYPGCPYCGSAGFFLCECGHLNCWDGKKQLVKCAWCGNSGTLSGGIESITATGNM